jgi:hypothetical protein
LLQPVCEDTYIALGEIDHKDEDENAIRNQGAIIIRREGHAENEQGYTDVSQEWKGLSAETPGQKRPSEPRPTGFGIEDSRDDGKTTKDRAVTPGRVKTNGLRHRG